MRKEETKANSPHNFKLFSPKGPPMRKFYMSEKVLHLLNNSYDYRDRHEQVLKLVVPLTDAGWHPLAVLVHFYELFGPKICREFRDVLMWHLDQRKILEQSNNNKFWYQEKPRLNTPTRSLEECPDELLEGFHCKISEIAALSPVKIPVFGECHFRIILEKLFQPGERINVVNRSKRADRHIPNKWIPSGQGVTLTCVEWLKRIHDTGITPRSKEGVWIRINPVDGKCLGGESVTAFRYLLFKFKHLPMELQLSLISHRLPGVALILDTGGLSYHAWVKVDCTSLEEYKSFVQAIDWQGLNTHFGVDPTNNNASCFSRLPGASRRDVSRKKGSSEQKIVYLNPNPDSQKTII